MCNEGNCESEDDQGQVIDTKVCEILADSGVCFGQSFGTGDGGTVDEFGPRTALGEGLTEGGGDAGDEGAESGGGDRWLRLGGAGVGYGGLGSGDGECRWGGHGGA